MLRKEAMKLRKGDRLILSIEGSQALRGMRCAVVRSGTVARHRNLRSISRGVVAVRLDGCKYPEYYSVSFWDRSSV